MTKSPPLVLAAFVFAAAFPAKATVVVVHSIEEMSRRSDVIVHARVLDSTPVRENGRIVTLSRLEVVDGLKGAKAGDVLTVFQVGGTIGKQSSKIVGAHVYAPGEEIVWFGSTFKDRVVAYGIGIGKFAVQYDGAFQRVVEQVGDVAVMERDPSGKPTYRSPAARTASSLTSFKAEIQKAVALGHIARTPQSAKKPAPKALGATQLPKAMPQKKAVRFRDTLRAKPQGAR